MPVAPPSSLLLKPAISSFGKIIRAIAYVAAAIVFTGAFAGVRHLIKQSRQPSKATIVKALNAEVDSGELFEEAARRMEANPRTTWSKQKGDSKLRSFERSVTLELQKFMKSSRSLGISVESLPLAEHVRISFEGMMAVGDAELPVRGQWSTLFFDRGAIAVMGAADYKSYADTKSAYSKGMQRAIELALRSPDQLPKTFLNLKGWDRVPDSEMSDVPGGVVLTLAPKGRYGMIIAIPQTPKELADAIRASQADSSFRDFVKGEIDHAVRKQP